jgi:hypothetical protein
VPVVLPVTLPVTFPVTAPIKPFVDVTGPEKVVDAMIFPYIQVECISLYVVSRDCLMHRKPRDNVFIHHLKINATKKGAEAPFFIRLQRNRTCRVDRSSRSCNAHETCNARCLYRSHRPCCFAGVYEQSASYR